jgi:hypothetical protein
LENDKIFKTLYGNQSNDSDVKYDSFDVYKYFEKDIFGKLSKTLDGFFVSGSINKGLFFPNWNDKSDFYFIPKYSINNPFSTLTQSQRVVFHAVCRYFEKIEENNPYDETKLKQWMRIVWNIVENATVNTIQSMIGVMRLIDELAEHSHDIYAFLADEGKNTIKSDSAKEQVAEECKKAAFINADNIWEELFIDAEKHPFFKGSVGFIISDNMTQGEFKHRTIMANAVFDDKGINGKYRENGHLFLRGLISKYTEYSQIINRNFPDIDEKEHYLRKMLASDEVVRIATREWFSLQNETALFQALNDAIGKKSEITGWDSNENTQLKMRKAHEALYKIPDLQKWMQQNNAIRFSRYWDGRIYISRARSWYDWIMLDTDRNQIIFHLLSNGFTLRDVNQQVKVGDQVISYFWGSEIDFRNDNNKFQWDRYGKIYLLDNDYKRIKNKEGDVNIFEDDVTKETIIEKLEELIQCGNN